MFFKKVIASNKTASLRYDVCKVCDSYNKARKICNECGCYMPAKRKLQEATCPLGKW